MATVAQWNLLSACLEFLQSRPELGSFSDPFRDAALDDFSTCAVAPELIPMQSKLSVMNPFVDKTSQKLVSAVQAASADMHWNRTYTEGEVDDEFLQNYGWFDIVAPQGPFVLDCDRRMMIGTWNKGLDYQAHWHDPAEVYVPIAGSATFWTEAKGHHIKGVGDAVFHTPNEKHATNFDQSPFMALILWQAEDLVARLSIDDRKTGLVITPKEIG